jgi:hypothetical protein
MKENTATSVTFKKDPLSDRRAMIDAMKGFKNSKFPENPFKDGKPQTAIDEFYAPHAPNVKR